MTISYFIPYMLCFSEIFSESVRCGSQSSHNSEATWARQAKPWL